MPTIAYPSENLYELLKLDPTADADAVKAAIQDTNRRYRKKAESPDLERRQDGERVLKLLTQAREIFATPEARAAYDQHLVHRPAPESPDPESSSSDTNAADWVETAKEYLANGQARNAHVAAVEATRLDPNELAGWIVRAYAAVDLSDYKEADFAGSEAQRRDPENPRTAGLLGDIYDGEGLYAQAERAYARAAELEPENAYWQARVAWALGDQAKYAEAITQARSVVAAFPESDYARTTLANQLLGDAEAAASRRAGETGYSITNAKQITHFEARIAEVEKMSDLSDAALQYLAHVKDYVAVVKKRTRNKDVGTGGYVRVALFFAVGTWLLLLLTTSILGGSLGTLAWLALNAAYVYRKINRYFPQQWKINRDVLGSSAMSGLQ